MDFSYLDDWVDEEAEVELADESGAGYRNVWVAGETARGELLADTLATIGQARDLADQIGCYVYALVLGTELESAAQKLIGYGADRVLVADDPRLDEYQPEIYVKLLADLVEQYRPEILLVPGTTMGRDFAPRLAQRLNTALISHCVKLDLDMSERLLLGTFPTLGGEVYHTVACPIARPQMATLEPGYFGIPFEDIHRSGQVQTVEINLDEVSSSLVWQDSDTPIPEQEISLTKAKTVVCAGRGMTDAEGFAQVERLAEALGGVVAGSRGAFDEGWISEDQIVGVGGTTIAPDLYVACGLSGDIYHYYGLQEAKLIVAINRNPEAPIMKVANMAVVGDARELVPAMVEFCGGSRIPVEG